MEACDATRPGEWKPATRSDPEIWRPATRRGKVVAGLGNPGPEYDATRHNVGWWVVDRFAYDNDFGAFERGRSALEASGEVDGRRITLLKPRTYMNRSGAAVANLWRIDGFEVERDLLVVTDDATLPVGKVRFRRSGGAGGHNGLKSVSAALGTQKYARLRLGVGIAPAGVDMADWVLSPVSEEDEDALTGLLPELSRAVGVWAQEGVDVAMNRFNR